MGDFHFMYPHWLWLLLLIPILWSRLLLRRQNDGGWSDIVDEQLAPFVLTGRSKRNHFRTLAVISLLIMLSVLAIAGPSWEKREIPAFRKQEAVVVGLDLSASMYARDASPNRLDSARFKLLDLLKTRRDGQTGLVVFAGDAFTVSPLTDDTETISAQVKSLSPEIMPVQGSYVDLAIQRAIEVLDQAAFGEGNILLITDGATDTQLARAAAEQAVAKGYSVSVLGVGTEQGAPIPMSDGGFLTDSMGRTVVPKLAPGQMKAIANAGRGVFTRITLNDADINQLAKHWEKQGGENKLIDGQERQLDAWFNQGIWLVILLIPVAMLFFRRGWLTVFLLVMLLQQQETAEASLWDDLWFTSDQQGKRSLQAGDAATASELFNDLDWKAAAAYRAGDFATAESLYKSQEVNPDGQGMSVQRLYNYGNTLAMLGKLGEAIKAYEDVLALEPEHEDARYNLELLKKQQQEQEQQQQGQQNQQNNGEQQQNQNGAGQQSENADSQSAQQGQEQEASPAEQQEAQKDQSSEQEGEGDKQSKSEQEAEALDAQTREQKQATEQWLRRIPDDPSGLWRRKFQYQYRQRNGKKPGEAW